MKLDNETALKLAMDLYEAALALAIDDNGDKRNFDNIDIQYHGNAGKTIRGALLSAKDYFDGILLEVWK